MPAIALIYGILALIFINDLYLLLDRGINFLERHISFINDLHFTSVYDLSCKCAHSSGIHPGKSYYPAHSEENMGGLGKCDEGLRPAISMSTRKIWMCGCSNRTSDR